MGTYQVGKRPGAPSSPRPVKAERAEPDTGMAAGPVLSADGARPGRATERPSKAASVWGGAGRGAACRASPAGERRFCLPGGTRGLRAAEQRCCPEEVKLPSPAWPPLGFWRVRTGAAALHSNVFSLCCFCDRANSQRPQKTRAVQVSLSLRHPATVFH